MVTYDQLMQPLMTALVNLGGSGRIDEIYEAVLELEKLDEETLGILHNPEKSSQTEIGYRLAWARTYLKKGSSRLTGKCVSDLEKEVGAIPVTVCHAFDNLYLVVHAFQAAGVQSITG